ncbi:MAG: ComF family protein [Dehalococcoidales bacterium]
MLPQLSKFKEAALDLLFPKWCLGCGREGAYICHSCRRRLPEITPALCPVCGKSQIHGQLCPSCVSQRPEIDGIRSPFRFEGLIRRAVHELKYRNLRALAQPLAGLLNEYLVKNRLPGEVLVPVPLHPKRLRQRGYNQSQLLAKELGRLARLAVVSNYLLRQRPSPPQTGTTSAAERQANVAGAFSCRDERLKGKQVLLIDDVATSGATLSACAAALKAAGAGSVWGLTIAREV